MFACRRLTSLQFPENSNLLNEKLVWLICWLTKFRYMGIDSRVVYAAFRINLKSFPEHRLQLLDFTNFMTFPRPSQTSQSSHFCINWLQIKRKSLEWPQESRGGISDVNFTNPRTFGQIIPKLGLTFSWLLLPWGERQQPGNPLEVNKRLSEKKIW